MRHVLRKFKIAVSFLTIIPVPNDEQIEQDELAGSLAYYPLVGLLIGVLLVLVAWIGNLLGLGYLGNAIVIVFWLILTGGLHADGLMDTADGIFSGKQLEQKLEIMRDSRVGAMGIIVFLSVILLKLTALISLWLAFSYWALLVAPIVARLMVVVAVKNYPYARKSAGLGDSLSVVRKQSTRDFSTYMLVNGVFWGLLVAYTLPISIYNTLGIASGLLWLFGLLAGVAVIVVYIMHWLASSLGGLTGDTYGAIIELTETLVLVFCVIGVNIVYV